MSRKRKQDPDGDVGAVATAERRCRECGCTDSDCRQCIERTGEPCSWVEDDLCSACADPPAEASGPDAPIASPPAPPALRDIPLEHLLPTNENPRRFVEDADFAELVESIRQDGILVPLIARPFTAVVPDLPPAYMHAFARGHQIFDLRAGRRRWEAARKLGMKVVPVVVREMDDLAALRVTIKENLDRHDLTPLEEACGVASYVARGLDYEAIAAEFGRTPAWVARRERLTHLALPWAEHVTKSDHWLSRWPVASLEQVAALAEDEQLQLWKLAGGGSPYASHGIRDLWEGRPDRIRDWIVSEITHELKRARWNLDDATLVPKAGACSACPHRTGAQPLLWTGLGEDRDIRSGDRCLRPPCWKQKARAQADQDLEKLKAKHPDLVVCDGGSWGGDKAAKAAAKSAAKKHGLQCVGSYEARDVQKTAPNAVPAVKIGEHGLSKKVTWIARPVARVSPATGTAAAKSPAKPRTLKQLRAELEARRSTWAVDAWCDRLAKDAKDVAKELYNGGSLSPLEIIAGVWWFGSDIQAPIGDPFEGMSKCDRSEPLQHVLEGLVVMVADAVKWDGRVGAGPRLDMIRQAEGWPLFEHFKGPFLADYLEKATTEIPEPAEWANLNADGTPKSVAGGKKKAASKPKAKTKSTSAKRRKAKAS